MIELAGDAREFMTIFAIRALAHRGMNLLRAKRAVEAMIADGKAFLHVPKVESLAALTRELAEAGVRAVRLPEAGADVHALRAKLGLTQEQFAVRYGLDIDAVRNWETGRRTPDTAAQSYLRAIHTDPDAVLAALWRQTA
jgi:putative transcriptional regulator